MLDALLERGFRYAMTSNSDNLGAAPSARIAGWFAASHLRHEDRVGGAHLIGLPQRCHV